MKYGNTLRQRSIPEWAHYNIDYDDLKRLIKTFTTPGHGQSVAIPGREDEPRQQFEDDLFAQLVEQHDRIGLFVKSKIGEIRSRLEHLQGRASQLNASTRASGAKRITAQRLERYGRLETEVIR